MKGDLRSILIGGAITVAIMASGINYSKKYDARQMQIIQNTETATYTIQKGENYESVWMKSNLYKEGKVRSDYAIDYIRKVNKNKSLQPGDEIIGFK